MGRLIDADAIEYFPLDEVFNRNVMIAYKKRIDSMPTVDAEPVRHGMWLPKHHYIAGYEFVSGHICSECGDDALNAEGDEFLTDYCPNCGAKMDAERKSE